MQGLFQHTNMYILPVLPHKLLSNVKQVLLTEVFHCWKFILSTLAVSNWLSKYKNGVSLRTTINDVIIDITNTCSDPSALEIIEILFPISQKVFFN